ncbi:MAG: hypothetical protein EA384_13215 [Spirochaetaceae bacterium]|nr:MAG: hypothetical protein EA384_13215 [Spirochaetaceae bacterium]
MVSTRCGKSSPIMKGVLGIIDAYGSLDSYFRGYVNSTPLHNSRSSMTAAPCVTQLSDMISKNLKARGFTFVGSTICYAFMQAIAI